MNGSALTLGMATVFYADYIYSFFFGGKNEPSGWLSTEALKLVSFENIKFPVT